MSKKKSHPPGSLDEAVEQFALQYRRRGSGIRSVSKGSHGIKVVVSAVQVAGQLPGTFNGYHVFVSQYLGPAGEKAIIRDSSGRVVGFQG